MKQRSEDRHACHKAVCHPCVNSALYTVTLLSSADIGFSVLLLDVDFQQYTCSEALSLRLLKLFTIHGENIPFSFLQTQTILPSRSFSVFVPGSQPLCCNWKQLRQGYYSADRAAFGGGPRLHTEDIVTLNAIKSPQVASFKVGLDIQAPVNEILR